MITELLTYDEMKTLCRVTISGDSRAVSQYILDSQILTLYPLIGEDMYYWIVNNPTLPEVIDLMDGVNYTYENNTVKNEGVKVCLAHWSFARYLDFGSGTNTAYSTEIKMSGYGVSLTAEQWRALEKRELSIANSLWNTSVLPFIIRNKETYSLYEQNKHVRNNTFKF